MTGAEIIARYNSAKPGERFEARVSEYGHGLRMWLLEAGARHSAVRDGEAWRLSIERRSAPAQGSIPGVHHVVSDGRSVWACERARRVARIDAGRCEVAAVRPIARKASHLALHQPSGRLFVADAEGCEIVALRASDLEEIGRWPAPGMPQLPLVTPEGIVCVTGAATGTVTIARPHAEGYRATTVPVGACPHDPCIDASGEHLFVPCAGEASIVKVRLADAKVAGKIAVGEGPSHLALHPDGKRLYCANSWSGTVTCISTQGERLAEAKSGGWTHAIEVSPDGRSVYAANFREDTLAIFAAERLERIAVVPTEAYAHGLDVSPDGRYVVSTGFCSDAIRFHGAAGNPIARIAVGTGSSHTAFAANRAWVSCSVSDHLACIELDSLESQDPLGVQVRNLRLVGVADR